MRRFHPAACAVFIGFLLLVGGCGEDASVVGPDFADAGADGAHGLDGAADGAFADAPDVGPDANAPVSDVKYTYVDGDLACDVAACPTSTEACTVPHCGPDGECQLGPADDFMLCSDGNACTTNDQCMSDPSVCMAGPALACADGNPCTTDACDPKSGCMFAAQVGGCTDNNACTVGDTCKDAACLPGAPLACGDGNPCTDDSCAPATGCKTADHTGPCTDNKACTEADACSGGACKPGTQKACDDGNACTTDACDPLNGCGAKANSLPCDDGSVCTQGDACTSGKCASGKAITCDDGNPCSDDACSPGAGCQALPNTKACDDGNACTAMDACAGGKCAGTLAKCDDANPCTVDYCDAGAGCQTVPNAVPCDDKTACTEKDVCVGGNCAGQKVTCDDGNPCTADTCDAGKGCGFPAVKDGTACGEGGGGVCSAGACSVGSDLNPGTSCKQVLAVLKSAKSGLYWLDPDGKGAGVKFQAHCDMVTLGGGWTLVLKADGNQATFTYGAALWTNTALLNADKPALDAAEAKLPGFMTVPFTDVLVGMKVGTVTEWLQVPFAAPSLSSVFADGQFKPVKVGRAAWKGLIAGSSLQPNCNREGFNNYHDYAAVRVGMIANQENDCASPDSRIGLGGAGTACGQDGNNTVGNTATCAPDNGDKSIKGFGYLLVR